MILDYSLWKMNKQSHHITTKKISFFLTMWNLNFHVIFYNKLINKHRTYENKAKITCLKKSSFLSIINVKITYNRVPLCMYSLCKDSYFLPT